jgi:hypothetical protein
MLHPFPEINDIFELFENLMKKNIYMELYCLQIELEREDKK